MHGSLWVVFLRAIIDGLTAGIFRSRKPTSPMSPLPEKRARSFGVIGIAFGIGFMVGPGISGFLSQYGYAYPILAAAFLSASSIVCTSTLLPKAVPHPGDDEGAPAGRRLGVLDWKGYAQYFARPGLGLLLGQFFCFAFSFSFFVSGFALYAHARYNFEAKQVGYVFLYAGFLGAILQGGLIGRLVKWLGERTLVWTGFASAAVGYALLAWTHTVGQLLGASSITAYGTGVLRPAVTSLITQKAGKREQGVVLGLTQSLTSVSQIVAPLIGTSLIGAGHPGAWALATGGVAFIGFLISLPSANAASV